MNIQDTDRASQTVKNLHIPQPIPTVCGTKMLYRAINEIRRNKPNCRHEKITLQIPVLPWRYTGALAI